MCVVCHYCYTSNLIHFFKRCCLRAEWGHFYIFNFICQCNDDTVFYCNSSFWNIRGDSILCSCDVRRVSASCSIFLWSSFRPSKILCNSDLMLYCIYIALSEHKHELCTRRGTLHMCCTHSVCVSYTQATLTHKINSATQNCTHYSSIGSLQYFFCS